MAIRKPLAFIDNIHSEVMPGDAIGVTSNNGLTQTDGMVLQSTTAATSGLQQSSPVERFHSSWWDTSTGAAKNYDVIIGALGISQATAGTTTIGKLAHSINGGAYSNIFSWNQQAAIAFNGAITAPTTISTTSGGIVAGTTLIAGSGYCRANQVSSTSTSLDGLVSNSNTPASAGTPVRRAGRLNFNSNVWDTETTISKISSWLIDPLPISGNPPSCNLEFKHSLAGAAYSTHWIMNSTEGNLGYGTSNPLAPLQVSKTSAGAAVTAISLQNASNSVSTEINIDLDSTGSGIGVRSSQVASVNTAVSQTKVVLRTSNGATPVDRLSANYIGVGIGSVTQTAQLHIPASSGNASSAPIKIDNGSLLGTPENGAIERNAARLYFTDATPTRRQIHLMDASNPSAITVGASPYIYQNTSDYPEQIITSGGTISNVEYTRDNTNFYSVFNAISVIILNPSDRLKVTYSSTPTMTKIPI